MRIFAIKQVASCVWTQSYTPAHTRLLGPSQSLIVTVNMGELLVFRGLRTSIGVSKVAVLAIGAAPPTTSILEAGLQCWTASSSASVREPNAITR